MIKMKNNVLSFILLSIIFTIGLYAFNSRILNASANNELELEIGRYYLNGDLESSYIDVYDNNTLQCFYKDYEEYLISIQDDKNLIDKDLLKMAVDETKPLMYYRIRKIDDDHIYIEFNSESIESLDEYGNAFYYLSPESIGTSMGEFIYTN